MKNKSIFTVLILTLLFLPLYVFTADGDSLDQWIFDIAGKYKGIINSNNIDIPSATTFEVTKSGKIKGSYQMNENGTLVIGKLYDIKVVGYLKIECRWHDKYGEGNLYITFSEDLDSFDGMWDADGYEIQAAWNGVKVTDENIEDL